MYPHTPVTSPALNRTSWNWNPLGIARRCQLHRSQSYQLELKRSTMMPTGFGSDLSIVPVGIETTITLTGDVTGSALNRTSWNWNRLTSPWPRWARNSQSYQLELKQILTIFLRIMIVLSIVPVGIETITNLPIPARIITLNRTSWNWNRYIIRLPRCNFHSQSYQLELKQRKNATHTHIL